MRFVDEVETMITEDVKRLEAAAADPDAGLMFIFGVTKKISDMIEKEGLQVHFWRLHYLVDHVIGGPTESFAEMIRNYPAARASAVGTEAMGLEEMIVMTRANFAHEIAVRIGYSIFVVGKQHDDKGGP